MPSVCTSTLILPPPAGDVGSPRRLLRHDRPWVRSRPDLQTSRVSELAVVVMPRLGPGARQLGGSGEVGACLRTASSRSAGASRLAACAVAVCPVLPRVENS